MTHRYFIYFLFKRTLLQHPKKGRISIDVYLEFHKISRFLIEFSKNLVCIPKFF